LLRREQEAGRRRDAKNQGQKHENTSESEPMISQGFPHAVSADHHANDPPADEVTNF
jgi:hypothetical protein